MTWRSYGKLEGPLWRADAGVRRCRCVQRGSLSFPEGEVLAGLCGGSLSFPEGGTALSFRVGVVSWIPE